MNARTNTIFAEPNFAKDADRKCDVSDNWIDEVDPQNVQGAEVTAYFNRVDDFLQLTGICVEETSVTTWEDRASALKLLTPQTVRRIEDIESEALAYGEVA